MPRSPRSVGAQGTALCPGQAILVHGVLERPSAFGILPKPICPHLPMATKLLVPARKTKFVGFGTTELVSTVRSRLNPDASHCVAADAGAAVSATGRPMSA